MKKMIFTLSLCLSMASVSYAHEISYVTGQVGKVYCYVVEETDYDSSFNVDTVLKKLMCYAEDLNHYIEKLEKCNGFESPKVILEIDDFQRYNALTYSSPGGFGLPNIELSEAYVFGIFITLTDEFLSYKNIRKLYDYYIENFDHEGLMKETDGTKLNRMKRMVYKIIHIAPLESLMLTRLDH